MSGSRAEYDAERIAELVAENRAHREMLADVERLQAELAEARKVLERIAYKTGDTLFAPKPYQIAEGYFNALAKEPKP